MSLKNTRIFEGEIRIVRLIIMYIYMEVNRSLVLSLSIGVLSGIYLWVDIVTDYSLKNESFIGIAFLITAPTLFAY